MPLLVRFYYWVYHIIEHTTLFSGCHFTIHHPQCRICPVCSYCFVLEEGTIRSNGEFPGIPAARTARIPYRPRRAKDSHNRCPGDPTLPASRRALEIGSKTGNVLRQCYKPPMTGNGKHTTYKGGEIGDCLLLF